MKAFLTILLSYLIGSISSAYILGKLNKNIDIRSYGSGNAGATNALRVLGKKLGAFTLILDVLKGVIASIIGMKLLGYSGMLMASIFVVIGHNWPVFLNFKGGKGVATSFGVLLVMNWKVAIICLAIAIIIVSITKYVSLGSIIAAMSAPIVMILFSSREKYLILTTLFLGILCVYRHKSNIIRLLQGKENKLGNKI